VTNTPRDEVDSAPVDSGARQRIFRRGIIIKLLLLSTTVSVILIGLMLWITKARMGFQESDAKRLLEFLGNQKLKAGSYPAFRLPVDLQDLAEGGVVDLVRMNDGRHVVLVKTSVGFKQNYSGFVCSDRPLLPSEVQKDAYGRKVITIPGLGASDPVIRRKVSDTLYEVFFDLG
jgi:hypothetical protein